MVSNPAKCICFAQHTAAGPMLYLMVHPKMMWTDPMEHTRLSGSLEHMSSSLAAEVTPAAGRLMLFIAVSSASRVFLNL